MGGGWEMRPPQGECYAWVGWQGAIGRLGLDDLTPLVEDVFSRGWISPDITDVRHFYEDLRATQQGADPTEGFDCKDDGRLDDVVRHMSEWAYFRPSQAMERRPNSVIVPGGKGDG
jgi:hypothetical protein